jgi:3-oxoacyl-[acyl-carrier-protein] synthase II
MASSSSIEAIAAIMSIKEGIIPETINIVEPDKKLPFQPLLNNFSNNKVETVLSNSFAFGGNICCIVISKFKE